MRYFLFHIIPSSYLGIGGEPYQINFEIQGNAESMLTDHKLVDDSKKLAVEWFL